MMLRKSLPGLALATGVVIAALVALLQLGGGAGPASGTLGPPPDMVVTLRLIAGGDEQRGGQGRSAAGAQYGAPSGSGPITLAGR